MSGLDMPTKCPMSINGPAMVQLTQSTYTFQESKIKMKIKIRKRIKRKSKSRNGSLSYS